MWLLLIFIPFLPGPCLAHAHHTHTVKELNSPNREELLKISATYDLKVKPIFLSKCMDCHSGLTRFPWYYQIPGVKQVIDSDITNGRKHIDFESGFPFKGHGSPEEDLKAIEEVVSKNSMPLTSYRWLHRDANLSWEEKEMVLNWVRQSSNEFDRAQVAKP